MANSFYKDFKRACLAGEIDLVNDTIKVYAVDTDDYTFSDSHSVKSDITAGSIVSTSAALAGKTIVEGNFDSDDSSFSTVTGDQFEALVLFDDTADQLIAYYDNFLKTPDGSDIAIVVSDSGWFDL